jgi:hypothetical protein
MVAIKNQQKNENKSRNALLCAIKNELVESSVFWHFIFLFITLEFFFIEKTNLIIVFSKHNPRKN